METWERKIRSHYMQTYREMARAFEIDAERLKKTSYYKKYLQEKGIISDAEYKAYAAKVDREMHKQVGKLAKQLGEADAVAIKSVNSVMPKAYATAANEALYEVEKTINMATSLKVINPDAVSRAVRAKYAKKLKKAKNVAWNERRISSVITQSVLKGEGIEKVARSLLPLVDGNKKVAIRDARTWLTSVQNGGRFDESKRLEDVGVIMQKMWLSVGDMKVRDSHILLDGEVKPLDEPFSNGGMYPADPQLDPSEYYNCRCTILTFPVGFEPDFSGRVMDINGMTYEEWKRSRM